MVPLAVGAIQQGIENCADADNEPVRDEDRLHDSALKMCNAEKFPCIDRLSQTGVRGPPSDTICSNMDSRPFSVNIVIAAVDGKAPLSLT